MVDRPEQKTDGKELGDTEWVVIVEMVEERKASVMLPNSYIWMGV